jgi:hypothetical protein
MLISHHAACIAPREQEGRQRKEAGSVNRETVDRLWQAHKQDGWPRIATQLEGPLMTLDTVISGCVVYFLDSEEGLDEQRRTIVGDCLGDLETIEHELEEDCRPYFQRLRELGALLLITPPKS